MMHTDVREILPAVTAPTLVLHREQSGWLTLDQGRYIGEHIPGAQFEAIPGADMVPFTEPNSEVLDHIERFLTGSLASTTPQRVLAAILFTDIVQSTAQAAAIGDRRWTELLSAHDAVVRSIVAQHRGRFVKSTGDGMLATFDGPGRAIACARALRDALRSMGISIRAGLHTGEVEMREDDLGGIGVHIAARIMELANGDELLTSAAVPMLVAGSGIEFDDRGEHDLKGLPRPWRIFAVR